MYKLKLLIIFSITFLLIGPSSFAQVPNLLNYQGVALNSTGQPIANSNINIRVRFNVPSGPVLYQENRIVTTDNQGHFAFQIGNAGATNIFGSINNITWGTPGLGMSVFMDPTGGSNFTHMGTDTLATVPHSFSAKEATYADTLMLPYQRDDNSVNSFVVNNDNTSTFSNAIVGRTFGGNANNVGVLGEVGLSTINGTGVRGRSYTSGSIAVEGISTGGTGVRAKSGSTGTALIAENTNTTGKALDVNGNVKIAGGNTSPGAGKILTSDASGNASWQAPHRIAFKANSSGAQNIAFNSWVTPTTSETLDLGGNYNPNTTATDPNTFIAPVSGYYSLSAYAYLFYNSNVYNISDLQFRYTINGIPTTSRFCGAARIFSGFSTNSGQTSELFHLNAGDKLKFQLFQTNGGSDPVQLSALECWGILEFAD